MTDFGIVLFLLTMPVVVLSETYVQNRQLVHSMSVQINKTKDKKYSYSPVINSVFVKIFFFNVELGS